MVGRSEPSESVDTVNTDDRAGAALAVDHLVALGHHRIAHINGGAGAGAPERSVGYQESMERHGLADFIQIAAGDYDESGGKSGAAELMNSSAPPTAIFASNDLSAIGALDQLVNLGLRVPDDVSLVGFDNTALAAMSYVSLTTVNQPTSDLGQAAIDLVVQRLDGRTESTHFVGPPTLVIRTSTAGPRTDTTGATP